MANIDFDDYPTHALQMRENKGCFYLLNLTLEQISFILQLLVLIP